MMDTKEKMHVEIWSDIMCPFCYIGKRNYEAAMEQFADANQIALTWHSFQLDPTIPVKQERKQNVYEYLSERKGMSYERSKGLHEGLIETAKQAGLTYNFDKAVVANSFDAHRMIQLAKEKGLGDEAEERLFYAYFTEGKDFGDHTTLIELGNDIGLSKAEVEEALSNDTYASKVTQDIQEASRIGVNGVPFFVFDRKYAISGAQPANAFLETLQQSFAEWKEAHPEAALKISEGDSCTTDGTC